MEHEAVTIVIAKATSAKEPKWTTMMAKNVRQVVNRAVETLANVPKQEERKLNLHLMGFEVKEGEPKKELVQRLNTELLQGQMKLRATVIVTTRQRLATTQASTSMAGAQPGAVLFKFATSEDH
jgi:hypothetical protein